MTLSANKINLISKWFVMIVCLVRSRELCFDLVWEWHEARVWRECLVTWICTYTWTSRWPLVWFNEVHCDVKEYFKYFQLLLWAAYRLCLAILWNQCVRVVLFSWYSSSWLCVIYFTALIILFKRKVLVSSAFSYAFLIVFVTKVFNLILLFLKSYSLTYFFE